MPDNNGITVWTSGGVSLALGLVVFLPVREEYLFGTVPAAYLQMLTEGNTINAIAVVASCYALVASRIGTEDLRLRAVPVVVRLYRSAGGDHVAAGVGAANF